MLYGKSIKVILNTIAENATQYGTARLQYSNTINPPEAGKQLRTKDSGLNTLSIVTQFLNPRRKVFLHQMVGLFIRTQKKGVRAEFFKSAF